MNFHKNLKKLKSNLLSIFLAIAVSLTTLPYTTAPLLIHADNAGGGGSGGGTAENVGGASDSRCGYRMYVVCFLQAFFGQSCKTFLDIVACPNWTKLQSVGQPY